MPLAEAGISSKAGEDGLGRGETRAGNRTGLLNALPIPVQLIPVHPSILKK
jgi:hypothetical protein